jgi:DNA-binding transcriptional ArsR family regulator
MDISKETMQKNSTEAALFLKQMANSQRLMILCVLNASECSVSELNDAIPLSQSALSQHLAKLRDSGFVSTRRDKQTIYYSLIDTRAKKIMQNIYEVFCLDA